MKLYLTLAFAVLLSSCASSPDVTYKYYPNKTTLNLKIIRTYVCSTDGETLTFTSIIPKLANSADYEATPYELKLKDLKGTMSNSNLTVGFTDDGRLSGINSDSTGQGHVVLKEIVSLLPFIGLTTKDLQGFERKNRNLTECESISAAADKGPLTLTFEGSVEFETKLVNGENGVTPTKINPDSVSATVLAKYPSICSRPLLANVSSINAVKFKNRIVNESTCSSDEAKSDYECIYLRHPALVTLEVAEQATNGCPADPNPLWSGEFPVDQLGSEFAVPLPKAKSFGNQRFELKVSDSGKISSIKYGADSGASQILSLGNAVGEGLSGPTAKERSDEIKAEADIIAQQQRLARCRANPKDCT